MRLREGDALAAGQDVGRAQQHSLVERHRDPSRTAGPRCLRELTIPASSALSRINKILSPTTVSKVRRT